MGDYAEVEVLFAESDFDPEERELMARLWDRYFVPMRSLWNQPDCSKNREELGEQVHTELRLPGTHRNWDLLHAEEIDGRRYYNAIRELPTTITPPFPRRFADTDRLREKYGIRPMWYAMFSPTDWRDDGYRIRTPIGRARKLFAENMKGIWRLLYSGWDERDFDALKAAAPEGSAGRSNLGRVFDRLPFRDYLEVVEFLAKDWGGDAIIELDYGAVAYCFGASHDDGVAVVRAEFESMLRIFEALRHLDVVSLDGEVALGDDRFFDHSAASLWIETHERRDDLRHFREWFLGDPGE